MNDRFARQREWSEAWEAGRLPWGRSSFPASRDPLWRCSWLSLRPGKWAQGWQGGYAVGDLGSFRLVALPSFGPPPRLLVNQLGRAGDRRPSPQRLVHYIPVCPRLSHRPHLAAREAG